jgi:hypothetical protein
MDFSYINMILMLYLERYCNFYHDAFHVHYKSLCSLNSCTWLLGSFIYKIHLMLCLLSQIFHQFPSNYLNLTTVFPIYHIIFQHFVFNIATYIILLAISIQNVSLMIKQHHYHSAASYRAIIPIL